MSAEPTGKAYVGQRITVFFDAGKCQHSGNCVSGLAEVFDTSRKPWIQPDAAEATIVAEVVRRCPSGALQFRLTSSA